MNLANLGILILTFKGAYLTASRICAYMTSELGNSRLVFAWREGSADTHAAPEPQSELSSPASQILPRSAAPACLLALPPAP